MYVWGGMNIDCIFAVWWCYRPRTNARIIPEKILPSVCRKWLEEECKMLHTLVCQKSESNPLPSITFICTLQTYIHRESINFPNLGFRHKLRSHKIEFFFYFFFCHVETYQSCIFNPVPPVGSLSTWYSQSVILQFLESYLLREEYFK